ncbi:matrix metalloproteinase-14 isoform X2 [Anthonomus grandis grandis]|uniref:matrix metalloproteinase-14 isoform X2 n=1 Tax=Anthonomus grandis grandis TaxID=2921223 RepID=UPI002166AF99|nr:matrix metalloproteinase-14 isoform X2 [Anthonomus grandis grandis]
MDSVGRAVVRATFVCFLALFVGIDAAEGNSAMLYLSQFGYLGPVKANSSQLLDESSFKKAVEDFQNFAGLDVTGELDDKTLETMALPRCGVKDKVGTGDNRAKRYALQGSRWKVKNLSYKISKYPPKLKRKDVDEEVQRAFNVWTDYTDLTFTPKTGQVHIEIRFESGEHGDGDPFDGPGGTLAHAYFPPPDQYQHSHLTSSPPLTHQYPWYTHTTRHQNHLTGLGMSHAYVNPWLTFGNPWFTVGRVNPGYTPYTPQLPGKVFGGDAHFDASESWTIDSYRGTNLFQVAAHEFGHSLGLSHSDVRSALMAPFYRGYNPAFTLDQDDVDGIQALYGKKTTKNTPSVDSDDAGDESHDVPKKVPGPDSGSAPDASLCKDPSFDTIFNSAEGYTYIFKGDKYWRLTEESVAPGYPKLISEGWPGLTGNIDAAFTYKNGKSYFFKGSKYWRYKGRKMDGDYPKEISEGFTGIPNNLDTAMVWSGNGKIYFFKGSKFWRFDPSQRPPVKSTYPKPTSNWEGVPENMDAAFQWTNGYTYFYKGGAYYRFNDRAFAVDQTVPAFPRSTAFWWFGCKDAPQGTIGTSVYHEDSPADPPLGPNHLKSDNAGQSSSSINLSTVYHLVPTLVATLAARWLFRLT